MSIRLWLSIVPIGLSLARPGMAAAAARPEPAALSPSTVTLVMSPAPLPSPARRWYGWQTLATDTTGLVLVWQAGRPRVGPVLATAGLASLVLGGPIVHAGHGRVGTAFISLALRTVSPTLGVLLLLASDSCGAREGCILVDVHLLALGLGLIVAPVPIDAAVLAYDPVDTEPPSTAIRCYPRMLPTTVEGRRGIFTGVGCTF